MKGHHGRMLFGIVFLILGVLLFLKSLGVLNFSLWSGFKTFWPMGLVLAGVAFMLRARAVGVLFLILTAALAGVFIAESFSVGEQREFTQQIESKEGIANVVLDIDYGAGEIVLGKGGNESIVRNDVKTSDIDNPDMNYQVYDDVAKISMSRSGGISFLHGKEESWDIGLSPLLTYDINIDYGASEIDLDISELNIDSLELNTGASTTSIIFGSYPTDVEIGAGASTFDFKFPSGYGVVVDIEGGALSTQLNGFEKRSGKYYSDGYSADGENIEITVEAGATTINSVFI